MPARRTVQLSIPTFIISAVCVHVIGVLSIFIAKWLGAHKSPFACDDYSIRNPFIKKQTIPTTILLVMSVLISLVIIIITEFIIDRFSNMSDTIFKYRTFKLPSLLVHIVAFESYFQLGYVMQMVVTQVTKYTVGRLRPHFYTVCQPANIVCGSPGQLIYDYKCTGDKEHVEEGRLSFFSGHSSISMYTATFLIIYLQARIGHMAPRVVLSTAQTLLFSGGLFVCYSRIYDYWHHPSDVAIGVMVGILGALYTCYAWADFRSPRQGYSPIHGKVKEDDETEQNPSDVKVDGTPAKPHQTTSDQASSRLPNPSPLLIERL